MNRRAATLAVLLGVFGCGEPVPKAPLEWVQYVDPYFPCSFIHPKGWRVMTEADRVAIYSDPEGAQKFFDPSSKGEGGSQLMISYEPANGRSLESVLNEYRDGMTSSGFRLHATEARSLENSPGYMVSYSGRVDERTLLSGLHAITLRDSTLYSLTYAGFNDSFESYRSAFDTLLYSLHFPRRKTDKADGDPSIPSELLVPFSNDRLSILYPDNFEPILPEPKGDVAFSLEFKGYRQDCTVRIDIFPSKGLSSQKVFDQNKKFYKSFTTGATMIDGVSFQFLDYTPAKNIRSKVYFGVKKDMVWRIITNVYQPLKSKIDPGFQRMVQSLRIK